MAQVIQVVGALLVLAAFAGLQFGFIKSSSRTYLVFNLVGSAVLTVLAVREEQWGFFLLEGVWAVVSAWSLAQLLRGRDPAAIH